MQYLLLICGAEAELMEPRAHLDTLPSDAQTDKWVEEMDGAGIRKFGSALRPTSTATTVRRRGGETLVSDGPFAETKEQIMGFDLIECTDLEHALEVAAAHPVAEVGTVEVRPIWPS